MEHTEAVERAYHPARESTEERDAAPTGAGTLLYGVLGLTFGVALIVFGVLLGIGVVSPKAINVSAGLAQAQAWISSFLAAVPSNDVAVQCAVTAQPDPQLKQLTTVMHGMLNGLLVKVMAIAMLVTGAAVGVVKNTPLPAISGVMGAMILGFGPSILLSLTC